VPGRVDIVSVPEEPAERSREDIDIECTALLVAKDVGEEE
jgi:hypothetical protein